MMRSGAFDTPLQLEFDYRFSRVVKERLKRQCFEPFAYFQDPFNPVLFTEDVERYVDLSNIVRALTCYRKDTLEIEDDDLILLLDVPQHTNEVVTVAEAAEQVEMTETAVDEV